MKSSSDLVVVAHAHGAGCIGLALALLRGADIPAFTDIFHTAHLKSNMSLALSGARISVPKSHASEAHALIAAAGPMHTRPLTPARRALLAVLFLSFGGGITPWAFFPTGPRQNAQIEVLDPE